jgi:hypothetical protein
MKMIKHVLLPNRNRHRSYQNGKQDRYFGVRVHQFIL